MLLRLRRVEAAGKNLVRTKLRHGASLTTFQALLSCLYAVGKERRLRKQQVEFSNELSDQQDKSADLEAA